jgi:hypothetical protein
MSEYKPMNVRSEEDFNTEERKHDEWCQQHWDEKTRQGRLESHKRREEKRQELREKFPFTCIVQGSYPEVDNANSWCWDHFGPRDGKCEYEHTSEYPGCPLVRATMYIQEGSYKDKEGNEHHWKEKAYKEVPAHEHEGVWAEYWLGKTGYDYGNAEFYFKNEADRDAFVSAVPAIGFGDRYDN